MAADVSIRVRARAPRLSCCHVWRAVPAWAGPGSGSTCGPLLVSPNTAGQSPAAPLPERKPSYRAYKAAYADRSSSPNRPAAASMSESVVVST